MVETGLLKSFRESLAGLQNRILTLVGWTFFYLLTDVFDLILEFEVFRSVLLK